MRPVTFHALLRSVALPCASASRSDQVYNIIINTWYTNDINRIYATKSTFAAQKHSSSKNAFHFFTCYLLLKCLIQNDASQLHHSLPTTTTTATVLQYSPLIQDKPGEPVPETTGRINLHYQDYPPPYLSRLPN